MASVQSQSEESKDKYMNSFMSFLQSDDPKGENMNCSDNTTEQSATDEESNEKKNDSTEQLNEMYKDSDYSNSNSTETDSSTNVPKRNVAKRGRKRKHADVSESITRVTPRRAASRSVKCYVEEEAYNDIDLANPDDPDYQFSDSDDDPDFDPVQKRGGPGSPEIDLRFLKQRKGRGRKRGRPSVRGRRSSSSIDSNSVQSQDGVEEISSTSSAAKKPGRPPLYPTVEDLSQVSDNTVSSTDDSRPGGKLSSAYNYAVGRSRQNTAVRLQEAPNLSDEQLELIESQFKNGDFVMSKKDADMTEHPPIWRIDGKSLLQKFQAFDKDGKTLYRNISTYSGWTSQAKALYTLVKVNFVFQSRYDTVVELISLKGEESKELKFSKPVDKFAWLSKPKEIEITEELKGHMPSFEIYLQTLISQSLDNNFLQEIYEENDGYFIDRVKLIDDLTEDRKKKVLELVKWTDTFLVALDIWPCVNTLDAKVSGKCGACEVELATMLSQFYGQPYDKKTLRSREPSIIDLENKNYQTCDKCSALSQLFNKVTHQKYEYYSQCKSTVTNMRVSFPNKTTTTVLRDLLANDEWINGLFRSICTSWVKIDNFYNENKSESQKIDSIESNISKANGDDEPKNQPEPQPQPQPKDQNIPEEIDLDANKTPSENTNDKDAELQKEKTETSIDAKDSSKSPQISSGNPEESVENGNPKTSSENGNPQPKEEKINSEPET